MAVNVQDSENSVAFNISLSPQTDGQTKRVNQCLKHYLRCMCFKSPIRWHNWLHLAEWCYNSQFHTSLNIIPFQALYDFAPPKVAKVVHPDCPNLTMQEQLRNRQVALQVIRGNLLNAQPRIKHQPHQHRTKRELAIGDMVYLKIQTCRQASLSTHKSVNSIPNSMVHS